MPQPPHFDHQRRQRALVRDRDELPEPAALLIAHGSHGAGSGGRLELRGVCCQLLRRFSAFGDGVEEAACVLPAAPAVSIDARLPDSVDWLARVRPVSGGEGGGSIKESACRSIEGKRAEERIQPSSRCSLEWAGVAQSIERSMSIIRRRRCAHVCSISIEAWKRAPRPSIGCSFFSRHRFESRPLDFEGIAGCESFLSACRMGRAHTRTHIPRSRDRSERILTGRLD